MLTSRTGPRILLPIAGLLTAAALTAPAAAAPAGSTIPGTGTFVVGQDFPAGIYRSTANKSCYWERAKNASGTTSSIITNDIGAGQRLTHVRRTDKIFRTRG